jgi:uncharacterized protein (TIGR02453 family)
MLKYFSMSKIKFILDYLNDLQSNNNREWFHANKARHKEANELFHAVIREIIDKAQLHDPTLLDLNAKETVFRIARDIRFSSDKTPYKTHFGAYVARGGRKRTHAGYYIHISNDDPFIGGGAWGPTKEQLRAIRQEIVFRPEEIMPIIEKMNKAGYKLYEGDKLKRGPKDFPADGPATGLLKYKHFVLTSGLSKEDLLSDDFTSRVAGRIKTLVPFNNFLNTALEFTGNV